MTCCAYLNPNIDVHVSYIDKGMKERRDKRNEELIQF